MEDYTVLKAAVGQTKPIAGDLPATAHGILHRWAGTVAV